MLIAEFAKATGLSRDTVRFYVRKALLTPRVGRSGTNRYQDFDEEQVERALLIREAQALGFTLREIAALSAEYARGDLTIARQIVLMQERLAAVDEQAARLARLRQYFAAKLDWLNAGADGPAPSFSAGSSMVSACGATLPARKGQRAIDSSPPAVPRTVKRRAPPSKL